MRNWQEIRLANRFSIPEQREQHRDTSGYKPSDLSFPQNEIFNNSGLNQIFFITPLQKEIEMEFILNEVGENFYEYNPTLSSFRDKNSSIELTLDIQIPSAPLPLSSNTGCSVSGGVWTVLCIAISWHHGPLSLVWASVWPGNNVPSSMVTPRDINNSIVWISWPRNF